MTATVLSGPERHRRWTTAEKLRLVEETLTSETTVAEIARRHDVHPNQLHLWRKQARLGLLSGGPKATSGEEVRFAPVAIAPERAAAPPGIASSRESVIEVEFAAGGRMRITGAVEHSLVSALIRALVKARRRR